MRETVPPTKESKQGLGGEQTTLETHPAFGLIRASRGTVMGGTNRRGAVLFDSEIQHNAVVTVTITTAERERSLNRDRISPPSRKSVLAQVAMSEAQWASFVSSMNTGNGVPCTIEQREDDWEIPGLPYEPRLAESISEVRNAGNKAMEKIREAFDVAFEKPTKGNLRHLKAMIDNAPSNMEFAAQSLSEHAENVVQKARHDIEAMVANRAQQLGIDPSALTPPELEAGDE